MSRSAEIHSIHLQRTHTHIVNEGVTQKGTCNSWLKTLLALYDSYRDDAISLP